MHPERRPRSGFRHVLLEAFVPNRRVFPTLGLLGLEFFFRDPGCPEQFPTGSRQVSDWPQKARYVIYMHFVCNYISDAYRPICNLCVISYKLHINYISCFLRPVGNLPGTCWKLFGTTGISKEKIQTEEPKGGKYSTVSFLFCSGGEGAWLFWPAPRSRATAEQRDNSSTWWLSVARLRDSLSRQ